MSLEDAKRTGELVDKKIKLAMPRIGCGLDRLQWDKVKQIIERELV